MLVNPTACRCHSHLSILKSIESEEMEFLDVNLESDFSNESHSELILSDMTGFQSFPCLDLMAGSSLVLLFAQQPRPPEVIMAVKKVLMMGIRNEPSPITRRMGRT